MNSILAHRLTPAIWNAIADLVQRSQSNREIYFTTVNRTDSKRSLLWCEDFGDIAIPLVDFNRQFTYFDVDNTGASNRIDDNPTDIVCPGVGDTVIVLDPFGAKQFPICIGVIQSKDGYWESSS